MGFGLLLVGYFTASIMSLNAFGGVFSVAGYILVCVGSKKLSQYDKSFISLFITAMAMTVPSALIAVGSVSNFLYERLLIPAPLLGGMQIDIIYDIKLILDFLFASVLCYCVHSIAKQTGEEKITYKSVRNFVFLCIAYLLQLLVWLSSREGMTVLKEMAVATLLPAWGLITVLITVFFNCAMLFSCYSRICDENDIEMPQKPSRFAFINRRREEKERKRQAYIEEAEKYKKEHPKK